MTTNTDTALQRPATLLPVVVVTWALLVSIWVVLNHVALTRLAEQADASTVTAEVRTIGLRLAELEQRFQVLARESEQVRREPAAMPRIRYEADRQVIDRRLAALEQSMGERLAADALQPLRARIDQLEARQTAGLAPRTTVRRNVATRTPPKPVEPAFRVLGAELRAGERFLSVLPAEGAALAQVRLLRPGEEEGGWRLTTIDGDTAVFQLGTEIRRLTVPAR